MMERTMSENILLGESLKHLVDANLHLLIGVEVGIGMEVVLVVMTIQPSVMAGTL